MLDWVNKCENVESLKRYQANAKDKPVIVAACDARMDALKNIYRGAFPDQLANHLARQNDKRMDLELPLAKAVGITPRPNVAVWVGLDHANNIFVYDQDKKTYHSSLSALRGKYLAEGGGSESWTGFIDPVTKETVAKTICVDPAKAHESRRSNSRK